MATKEELETVVAQARASLEAAEAELAAFESKAENHVYASKEEAEGVLEDLLRDRAFEDCQGAGNCGADEYRQEFIVDGVTWVGVLSVEYNRHDKTYYYIESSDFSIEAKA